MPAPWNLNAPLFALGTIWLNESNWVPVQLLDVNDIWVTGMPASGVQVLYNRQGDSVNQVFYPTSAQWSERGHGLYDMQIPSTIINQSGLFEYAVEPTASGYAVGGGSTGYKNFRAAGYVDSRVEARVFNAIASGFNTTNTMGQLLNEAGGQYEVFAGPCYNVTAGTLTFIVFLQLNGGLILTPTSSRVTVYDQAGTLIMDVTNSVPDAVTGAFVVQATSIALASSTAYKVRARVTYNGVEYDSGEMMQSFS